MFSLHILLCCDSGPFLCGLIYFSVIKTSESMGL